MHTSTCNKDTHTARKTCNDTHKTHSQTLARARENGKVCARGAVTGRAAPRHPLPICTPGALLKIQTYKFRVHTHPCTHAHAQPVYVHLRARTGGNFSLQGAGVHQRCHRSFRGARTAVLHHTGADAAHLDCIPCLHEQQRYCFCLILSMCVLK